MSNVKDTIQVGISRSGCTTCQASSDYPKHLKNGNSETSMSVNCVTCKKCETISNEIINKQKQEKEIEQSRKDDVEFSIMLPDDLEHLYFEETNGKYTMIYNNKIIEITEQEYIKLHNFNIINITNEEDYNCEENYNYCEYEEEFMKDFD